MCELFSLTSEFPTNVSFSMQEFKRHGGLSGPHKDGWGIAFYEHKDIRLIRETDAAATSPCLEFLKQHEYQSDIIVSHLRLATSGSISLENTQPFCRELGGRMHLFAHNGDLLDIQTRPDFELGHYLPIGETDSEWAFCHLLKELQQIWLDGAAPTLDRRFAIVSSFAQKIRPLGPANFIYSDSEFLFVHGHKRSQPGREGFHPPGLYWLCRSCRMPSKRFGAAIDGASSEGRLQQVALVASVPLTDERWLPFTEGELMVFSKGRRIT
jgi:glutamine amidotransferase